MTPAPQIQLAHAPQNQISSPLLLKPSTSPASAFSSPPPFPQWKCGRDDFHDGKTLGHLQGVPWNLFLMSPSLCPSATVQRHASSDPCPRAPLSWMLMDAAGKYGTSTNASTDSASILAKFPHFILCTRCVCRLYKDEPWCDLYECTSL